MLADEDRAARWREAITAGAVSKQKAFFVADLYRRKSKHEIIDIRASETIFIQKIDEVLRNTSIQLQVNNLTNVTKIINLD